MLEDSLATAILDRDTLKFSRADGDYILDLKTGLLEMDFEKLNVLNSIKALMNSKTQPFNFFKRLFEKYLDIETSPKVWYLDGKDELDYQKGKKSNNIECFGTYAIVLLYTKLNMYNCWDAYRWAEWFSLVEWLLSDDELIKAALQVIKDNSIEVTLHTIKSLIQADMRV